MKGVFLGLTELLDKAISCAERALSLDPMLAEAHVALGSALFALGRHDQAATALEAAIAHDPKHARAHAMLARVHWIGRGDIKSGIRELERAIAINPQFGYAHLQLANLYTEEGQYARAEDAARRAVDLQEQYISGEEGFLVVGAHTRLGYVFYRLGRYDDALKEYQTELLYLSASDHVLKERSLIELHQKLGAVYLRLDNAADAGATSTWRSASSPSVRHAASPTRPPRTTSASPTRCATTWSTRCAICSRRSRPAAARTAAAPRKTRTW